MEKILDVKKITKNYKMKNQIITAVNSVSFSGMKGEILGILGPNGAGKTTIVKSIATLIDYDEGEILINNYNNKKYKKFVLEKMTAVLEGSRNVYWRLTPIENMIYFASLKGLSYKSIKNRIDYLLNLLELEKFAKDEVRKFSRGMQQKVAIACALITDPEICLLDEPTLGLDIETALSIRKFIKNYAKQYNKLILITSHDMKFIENVCDRVIVIKEGKVITNDSIENLKKYFSKLVYKVVIENMNEKIYDEILNLNICDNIRFEKNQNKIIYFFTLNNVMKLYQIIDIFRKYNIKILEFENQKNDFEDIFLSIIK